MWLVITNSLWVKLGQISNYGAMFSAYLKTIVSLLFLFSSTLSKQITCCFLTNICLRTKRCNRNSVFLRNFYEKWHSTSELYPKCFVSDRSLRDSPVVRTSNDPLTIHSDSDITLRHYNCAPGRLPRHSSPPTPRANWWSDMGSLDSAVSHVHTVRSKGSWHTHCWFLCLATS